MALDRSADLTAALAAAPLDAATVGRLDREHVWHPYSSPIDAPELPVVTGARGVRLTLADGREVVDGMSSWWAAIHGYRVPEIDAAAVAQLGRKSHVMFGGLTHEPAVRLAARLVDLTPEPLRRVFLADSGSVAMEVAIKTVLQRERSAGRPGRHRLMTWRGGYHGDTFGAMAVCDPEGGMHHLFADVLPRHVFCDAPPAWGMPSLMGDESPGNGAGGLPEGPSPGDGAGRPSPAPPGRASPAPSTPGGAPPAPGAAVGHGSGDLAQLSEEALDPDYVAHLWHTAAAHAHELAGIVVEPVVQGAGGMRFHHPGYLRVLREICDEHDLLLVVDEIATGFGRTGTTFACERAGVVPDVMAVGKALTGGYVTMAAVLCTDRVAEEIGRGEAGVLMHGPTFMANPLAASIACASLDLLVARDWPSEVDRIERGLRHGLAAACDVPGVADVRVLGAIGVVQLDHPVDVGAVTAAALDRGVWLRPFRDLVYAMPPYACDEDDVAAIAAAVVAGAAAG